MKKRALSLLLCLVFLVGLMPTTALAAGGATDTWAVKLNVSQSDAYTYNGQKVLALGFGAQSDNLTLKTSQSMILAVDLEVFDLLKYTEDYSNIENATSDLTTSLVTANTPVKEGTLIIPGKLWGAKAAYAKSADGKLGYIQMQASQDLVDDKVVTEKNLMTMYIGFKSEKSVSDLQENSIRLINAAECATLNQTSAIEVTNGKGGMQQAIKKDGSTDTLTIPPEVVWNGIKPSEPAKPAYSGAIAAPTVKTNAGGKVELNAVTPSGGPGGETVQYGYSKTNDGKNITWQNSTTFNLTVGSTYYFYAKVVESATYAEKVSVASAAVPVADKALSSIAITGNATAAVPTKGSTTTVNLTATGNYDDSTTGDITAAAAWTVDPAYTGVSVSKGVVTIAPEAAAGKVTIKAEKDSKSNTHSITLSKASPALASMTISGADGVAVPPAASSPKEVTYTVSGKDQFGADYTPTAVSWNIDGTTLTGVSITSDGKLSVESGAATGSVTIKAVSGSIPATKTVSITKADPAVDTVTIGGGVTTLAVPAMDTLGTEKKVAATAAFTATLKDQYGADISSGTVTWSVSGNSGVIIDLNTGLLTISSSATDDDVTVTATAENGKTGTASVTINKATSAATFVQVKKGGTVVTTDSIVIPTSGSPATTVTYTAEVYDQYGALYTSDTPTWSITSATGVSVSAGTVSVDNTASAGTSVTLTATSSTNTSKTAAVEITLTDKDIPTVTANDITVTYDGNAIPDSKITGTATFNGNTVEGTWKFKAAAPTAVADSNDSVAVVFTPSDATTYAAVETNIKVTINRATPTGTPTYTAITTSGKKLSDAALAIGSITPTGGTIKWDMADTTEVTANTAYGWTYTPTDTANYNPLKDTITPYVVSYSGGGSYTPTYTITVDKAANGTVTVTPKTAKKGDTVTLTATPDKGYELDTIKALDKDGKELKLTDQGNGKYTFTMPAGKVTVKATFEDSNLVKFDDVSKGDYCYEAVKWAVKNGITSGIGNNRFGPNDPCTRGQIVTFLWRAAGSPEPKSMSSFSDVPADSYYAKAVAWAVEKGITSGTGDGKFSPEDPCTRAQSVTFLYRAAGSPAVIGSAEFSDVASDTYYAAAVAWAAKNGITSGIGGGQFGSDDECNRGHIVTFLFNAYGK